jgi:hypothetical protein
MNGFRFTFGTVCNAQIRLADGMKGLVDAPMLKLPSRGQSGDVSIWKPNLYHSPFSDDRLIARAESRRC